MPHISHILIISDSSEKVNIIRIVRLLPNPDLVIATESYLDLFLHLKLQRNLNHGNCNTLTKVCEAEATCPSVHASQLIICQFTPVRS